MKTKALLTHAYAQPALHFVNAERIRHNSAYLARVTARIFSI